MSCYLIGESQGGPYRMPNHLHLRDQKGKNKNGGRGGSTSVHLKIMDSS